MAARISISDRVYASFIDDEWRRIRKAEKQREREARKGKQAWRASWPKWSKLRQLVFERDGHRCVYCGNSDGPFECDHVVPLSRGGQNLVENLATSCKPCNLSKAAMTVEEWRARQRISSS